MIDNVLNRSCDESTCNELNLRLNYTARDGTEMNQTGMNRSCDELTYLLTHVALQPIFG
jgi:hypothetical protein